MAGETNSTTLGSIINSEMILAARNAFIESNNLVRETWFKDLTGVPTAAASYPVFNSVVITKPAAETTDVTTKTAITPTDVVLTVARRTARVDQGDLAAASATENMSAKIGQLIGEARAEQVDTDILGVMTTNYTSSVGATDSTDVSFANLTAAILIVEGNKVPKNLILGLHIKQWDHLRNDLIVISGGAATDRSAQGQQALTTGLLNIPVLGARLMASALISTGTDTNDMYLGILGNFEQGIGYAVKNASSEVGKPEVELNDVPSEGLTQYVHNYYDSAGIVRPQALVLVKSQTY